MDTEQDPSQFKVEASQPVADESRSKAKRPPSSAFLELQAKADATSSAEEKVRLSIEFMKQALAYPGNPRFEDFWAARRFCIGFFKETLSPAVRAELWADYLALSTEARRLKDIIDEQSAFAVEQIELAIQAIESDLSHYDELLDQIENIPFPNLEFSLNEGVLEYGEIQKELHFLNTFASRINALRKEIIKTGMRIRLKNQLFERLSAVGDKVFPRRKELIRQVSDKFLENVNRFTDEFFGDQLLKGPPLYVLREEIKSLQNLAKILTLNTHAFTDTRLKLSECWDKIKEQEKERKKEILQKKQVHRDNYDALISRITPLIEKAQKEEADYEEIKNDVDLLYREMRAVELGKEEVYTLKDKLREILRPFEEKERQKAEERANKERENEDRRKEQIEIFRKELEEHIAASSEMTIEQLVELRDKYITGLEALSINRAEKLLLEKLIKQMRDRIAEKKEKALLELSPEIAQSLEELKRVLDERRKLRNEIKEQIESYRKALGGSGFDFEKAMLCREQMETEKARLEKVNAAIEEIEEKIGELEGTAED